MKDRKISDMKALKTIDEAERMIREQAEAADDWCRFEAREILLRAAVAVTECRNELCDDQERVVKKAHTTGSTAHYKPFVDDDEDQEED